MGFYVGQRVYANDMGYRLPGTIVADKDEAPISPAYGVRLDAPPPWNAHNLSGSRERTGTPLCDDGLGWWYEEEQLEEKNDDEFFVGQRVLFITRNAHNICEFLPATIAIQDQHTEGAFGIVFDELVRGAHDLAVDGVPQCENGHGYWTFDGSLVPVSDTEAVEPDWELNGWEELYEY